MKQKNLIIGAIISIVVIIIVAILVIIFGPKIAINEQAEVQNTEVEENKIDDEPIVAVIEKEEEEEPEEQEYVKTAADITQELQEMDINIGTLEIPKTNYITEVYCKQNANKMEVMPCMLYTNEGPNKPGVTILVGHNRENGTLFSNNNLLEVNDEFYFTDLDGVKKRYVIDQKFVTANDDVSFYNTPSDVPIIAMQCCLTATNSSQVIIIMGKAAE